MYAANRRLTQDEQCMLKPILALNPSAQKLKQYVVSNMKKAVTLKDMHNLRAKIKGSTDTMQALCDLVEDISKEGKVALLVSTDGSLELLCFASKEMISLYHQYPEVLFLDGTYKVNKHGYPLYYFMVQDISGRGRGVFYAFVSAETGPVIDRMVEEFVKAVGDTRKTSCVIDDKDANEIAALQKWMPNTPVLLCTFHVLKNFKMEIAEQLITVDMKEDIFRAVRKIIYASAENFEDSIAEVKECILHNLICCLY